jgi:hypothetical protein
VATYAVSVPSRWGGTERPGVGWLPLFFAACIFLAPDLKNYTGKLVMSMGVLLLISGLLPGESFEFIFVTCQYFLFLAMLAGLGLDLSRNWMTAQDVQRRAV